MIPALERPNLRQAGRKLYLPVDHPTKLATVLLTYPKGTPHITYPTQLEPNAVPVTGRRLSYSISERVVRYSGAPTVRVLLYEAGQDMVGMGFNSCEK